MLRAAFSTAEQVVAIMRDYRQAGLTPAEVAMMAFAEKVTLHAYKVTQEDIEELRRHHFSDEEIFDITLAIAARNFFSKMLNGLGVEIDAAYRAHETDLRKTLTVGRPFD